MAVPAGREPLESWSLVAGKGLVSRARGPRCLGAPQPRGPLAAFCKGAGVWRTGVRCRNPSTITFSGAVLSGLRRAAKGETVTLLLDGGQADSIARLPFADQLEVVHRSQLLPVSVVCSVGDRVAPAKSSQDTRRPRGSGRSPGCCRSVGGGSPEPFCSRRPPAWSMPKKRSPEPTSERGAAARCGLLRITDRGLRMRFGPQGTAAGHGDRR